MKNGNNPVSFKKMNEFRKSNLAASESLASRTLTKSISGRVRGETLPKPNSIVITFDYSKSEHRLSSFIT